ncbi:MULTISPECIES: lipid-A-disaccharide synthase N-terminal domain-containing protein [Seohaeicola]|uniref:lipid-A-disaccharide synthase N-terminal domain-containing protein n=1 Tax=Seohaeicola TaxID=481178 RepID=UPI000AF35560
MTAFAFSPMLIVGFTGQILFTSRFLVQWLASERAKASVMPIMFWWFSIGGGLMLLIYSIWRQDPVFILGQTFGLVVYTRNLMLISKSRPKNDPA